MHNNSQQQALGFLGGTFDPIHFGHLRPALEISEALSLRKLFILPNHIAPHKSASHCSAKQRSEMVRLAIQQQARIDIDTRELNRATPSYTIETLKELKALYPTTPICFIMGMDSLISFDTWYQWQEILNYCHLIISQRPKWHCQFNSTVQEVVDRCSTTDKHDLHNLQSGKIYFQSTTQFDISSTEIRQLLKNNISIDYLVPEAVNDYIKEHQLYR
ncbi:MAG: nicotinate-nucleotide adenylyltransferase [Psychromonas sp.]|jgi:nicotinate-nucleotide adenylyltransferase|uniref:nicotinate-nucleotide adenylyltransferase n=1 Tax=Psychromonas sp. TaxID=1884585 RepID=UPI0039E395D8